MAIWLLAVYSRSRSVAPREFGCGVSDLTVAPHPMRCNGSLQMQGERAPPQGPEPPPVAAGKQSTLHMDCNEQRNNRRQLISARQC